jgi:hypothetical protein
LLQIFILPALFLCRGLGRKLFRKRILMQCENENKKYEQKNFVSENESVLPSWMKEEKGIINQGWVAYVFTSVHFRLRNEGSSEYICLWKGRESLSPNF